ncbi:MAG: hypothetical protein AAGC71_15615 [Pseudomonadota bacterium]
MVEITLPEGYPHRGGHQAEIQDSLLDVYRLMNIYLAEEKLYGITHSSLVPLWFDEDWQYPWDDPLYKLAAEFQWREITRILISSAATGRVLDDSYSRQLCKDAECGEFIADLDNAEAVTKLHLRDAFNKILHAEKIQSDFNQNDDGKFTFLMPIIHFYGTHGKRKWKAKLWVADYVRQYQICLARA